MLFMQRFLIIFICKLYVKTIIKQFLQETALYFTILGQVAIMCSFQILNCKTILLIFLVLCLLKAK